MKNILLVIFLMISTTVFSQKKTYCNPMDLDYTYMVYNSDKGQSYRSGADPAIVEFRGEYYMFVTRSFGYWHSNDLLSWTFIKPQKWYFQGSNAPAAHNYKDSLLYVMGDPSGAMSVLYTDNPKKGNWKPIPSILRNLQDPALFIDDDDKAYLYWGSSNKLPIRAKQLDMKKRFIPTDKKPKNLFNLVEEEHGWERFGENHFHKDLKEGYMEGPWMTKYNGKYYLQYAAPGTQFNVYADGVYVGDTPLGPFEYMKNNPMSYKPGGFMNGAGHGATLLDTKGQYWHFASMALSSNVIWERRLSMFPVYFDKQGLMYSNTHYGDYPRYAATVLGKAGQPTGWMLLSYKKPIVVSTSKLQQYRSTIINTDYKPEKRDIKVTKNKKGEIVSEVLNDENAKTFWVAEKNDDQQWIKIDLEKIQKLYAIQINFHDYKSGIYNRQDNFYHRYTIDASKDGQNWTKIVDKSKSYKDAPNAYEELDNPVEARYIRYNNIHVPTPYLALSDIRVFGLGHGKKPKTVRDFRAKRHEDTRDATFTWQKMNNATGYNIRWGIAPDKLYNSWLIYDKNELLMRTFDKNTTYYISIEAFNENGVGTPTKIVKI